MCRAAKCLFEVGLWARRLAGLFLRRATDTCSTYIHMSAVSLSLSIYIYIYTYTHVYIYIYMYLYIIMSVSLSLSLSLSLVVVVVVVVVVCNTSLCSNGGGFNGEKTLYVSILQGFSRQRS